MRDLLVLLVHLIATVFQLARPGGLRAVVAESVLISTRLCRAGAGDDVAPRYGKRWDALARSRDRAARRQEAARANKCS